VRAILATAVSVTATLMATVALAPHRTVPAIRKKARPAGVAGQKINRPRIDTGAPRRSQHAQGG
jgi:hypothetical protein